MFVRILGKCKGGTLRNPRPAPKFLKIVGNHYFHHNNYSRLIKTCFKKIWEYAMGVTTTTLGLAKGGLQEIFQKLTKMPQPTPNSPKIVENHSFHQNNYFRLIKTCFKNVWKNTRATGDFSKINQNASTYSKLSKNCRKPFLSSKQLLSTDKNMF